MKILTKENLSFLWKKISLQDYPNNEVLSAVINAIDQEKANKEDVTKEINDAIENLSIEKTPVAGIDFGTVKSGGDVAIQDGIITVLDNSHGHTTDNIDGLQVALEECKTYTDEQVANLINSAPETLDTLGELATAFQNNQEVIEVLNKSIAEKATQTYVEQMFQKVYPVGSVYISTIATNPNTLFGFGSWVRIKDRFILSAGDTYGAGTTGGATTHSHTSAAHSHSVSGHTHTSAAHTSNSCALGQ